MPALGSLSAQGPLGSAGAELDLRAWIAGDTVWVALRFDSPQAGEVLTSLREGLKSQVTYQLRLYRRQEGLFSFLGDRLLVERRLTRTASLDLFGNRYRLEEESGQRGFSGEAAFLEGLFSLQEFPLGPLTAAEGSECYVLARGRLEPVRVVAPLDIVRLITPLTSSSSRWVRAAIQIQANPPRP